MTGELLTELLKQGVLAGLLGFIGLTLWKRYDTRMKETSLELLTLRKRFEDELLDERTEMKLIIKETNQINSKIVDSMSKFSEFIQKQNEITNTNLRRNSTVMECLASEIKKAGISTHSKTKPNHAM